MAKVIFIILGVLVVGGVWWLGTVGIDPKTVEVVQPLPLRL